MAQPPLHLIIGNYNTSSWSLRAWLALRLARLSFVETRIPLRLPETPERIGRYSPSGKLPVLLAEGVPIWDSLAIAEFVAELEPGIWPLDPIARAEARAISAEVHSGFAELRRLMPMDIVGRFSAPGRLPRGLAADLRRVITIFEHCRARFAPQGPFLFGAFSIADAMMAPVATRLVTHGVPLAGAVEDYVDSLMAWPDMVTWCDAAAAEQAERGAEGRLGMTTITRPGRVLGPEAAASEAAPTPERAAVAVTGAGEAAPETVARTTLPVEAAPPPMAAEPIPAEPIPAAPIAAAPVAAAPAMPEPANAVAATPVDEQPAEADVRQPSPPAEPLPPAAAGSVGLRRRRLFEAAAAEEGDAAGTASAAAAPPASEAAAAGPGRKLGWLRHRVPAEHFDDAASPDGDGDPGGTGERAAEAGRGGVPPSDPGPAPERPPPPSRPTAPAIKPIGGGILRRR